MSGPAHRLVCGGLLAAGCLIGCSDRSPAPTRFEIPPAAAPTPQTVDVGRPWWRSPVFYEIFVRSFADASDGPLANDGVGDLRGLIERLDYLNDGDPATDADLEIGALWLMPIASSPSYHGYDATDYRTVDEDYGTNEDFRRLMREAHARGIRVIVDLVLNHTSSQHPWFLDAWRERSAYHDYYIWSYEQRDYYGPWGQPVWHDVPWWQRGLEHFNYKSYYGLFWSGMPDLDYRQPAVTAAMYEISRYWLEEMGADGFRLDAVRHLIEDGPIQQDTQATHDWLRAYRSFLRDVDPDALTVGEVWADTEVTATYGADELDMTFQFELAAATLDAVGAGDARPLASAAAEVRDAFPDGRFASFLTNHDQIRVLSELDGRRDQAALAAAILLAGPGVPFLYYGEEIGMTGLKPDPQLRRPMQWTGERHGGFSRRRPWIDVDGSTSAVNVAAQVTDPASLLSRYRRLIRLRNRHSALRTGSFAVVPSGSDRVYSFLRRDHSESILAVFNLAEEPVADYGLDLSAVGLEETGEAQELLTGSTLASPTGSGYRPLAPLPPLSVLLLHWQRPPL